jgi:hypothetical protein
VDFGNGIPCDAVDRKRQANRILVSTSVMC